MNRSTLGFLILTCPLLACSEDLPEVPDTGSSSSGDDPTGVTVDPTTTPGDSTTEALTTGLDSTGSSSVGEPESSSSGDPSSSSSGDPSTSSSGDPSSSSSAGPGCGDDMQDAGEECDGTDLAGYNCVTLGPDFTGGTLACAADCTFDTSGCLACGNDIIDGAEDCDGAALGGNTCATVGFVDGPLACAADCTFDTSGCTTCGNDVIDTGEACDGADLGGMGCADLGMGFTGGALGCNAACGHDTAACTNLPWPLVGEVVVTEIMQNPSLLLDADGEWFEVFNPTMGTSFQLGSCTFQGAADLGFTVDMDLVIGPGEYLVFSTDSLVDQGFVPDYQWLDIEYNLTNTSDTVRLVCNGVIVDEVSWDDGATFPDPNGQSMSLDPGSYDAVGNDDGANWCAGTISYNGDFGTPGTDNPVCGAGPGTYPIDFCRLQFPDIIDETQGTDVTVFGRLYSGGLTDLSGVNDLAPEVSGWVGWGPDGTDPAVDAGWTWTLGTGNPAYGPASPGYEANNDEYQAVLSVPAPGTYDFAFRFSGDDNATYTYCDGQPAGNSDGYQPANAGQMTSSPGAVSNLYFSEYAEGSSNNKAVEIYNASGSDADLTGCEVRFYFAPAVVAGNTVPLAGNLAADDVLVVCDDSIDPLVFAPAGCDVLAAGSFYNGDDSIELVCSGTTLDVIGQIGFDPGAEWIVGGVGTQNETIRRSCSVTAGDINGADVFDPSLEWASFPQDTFADFGQYMCP
jgi:Lamin Tail Domain